MILQQSNISLNKPFGFGKAEIVDFIVCIYPHVSSPESTAAHLSYYDPAPHEHHLASFHSEHPSKIPYPHKHKLWLAAPTESEAQGLLRLSSHHCSGALSLKMNQGEGRDFGV